ncbi:MAG: LCP family protein [Actinomycetales bacterium]|nr:LCP family protein [Actinomycetales bacterium]
MRRPFWHAPAAIMLVVLGVTAVGTTVVGLLLGSAPQGSAGTSPASAASSPGGTVEGQASQADAGQPAAGDVAGAALPTDVERMPAAAMPVRRSGDQQRTLLLQVRDGAGPVTNAVLLATSDGRNDATALLMSPGLLVPTPDWLPLAQTASTGDTLLGRNAVSMLLGVRVDASLILDRLALAAIVDAVGGIPIEIDQSVSVTDDGGGTVSIPAGSRVIDGVTAADYAIVRAPGEDEADRMARFADVLGRTLRVLPADPEQMRQLVLSLGSLAKSTQTNEQLVQTLLDLQQDAALGDLAFVPLPTTGVRGDGLQQLDPVLGSHLVSSELPDAWLRPGESPSARVVLRSAGAAPGQVAAALAQLQASGLTVIDAGGASLPLPTTRVLVQDASPVAHAMGLDVAAALSLPVSAIRIDGGARPTPDVVVLLGRDAPTLAEPGASPL